MAQPGARRRVRVERGSTSAGTKWRESLPHGSATPSENRLHSEVGHFGTVEGDPQRTLTFRVPLRVLSCLMCVSSPGLWRLTETLGFKNLGLPLLIASDCADWGRFLNTRKSSPCSQHLRRLRAHLGTEEGVPGCPVGLPDVQTFKGCFFIYKANGTGSALLTSLP